MLQRRQWCKRVASIDFARLVFLDETGAKTNMTRLFARTRKGRRAVDYAPHGRWNTTTLVAAITLKRAIAPMVLDGPMDTLAFEAYVEHVLIPGLPKDSIVVMDNLPAHKSPIIAKLLEAAGATLWYLPPYSPDFNPIEQMWSKIKNMLRGAKARTQEELEKAIAQALSAVSADDLQGFFSNSNVGIIT